MDINQYIKNSWKLTIHQANESIPYPYTVPCMEDKTFLDFYYWDAYFINKGLLIDGLEEQAENNLNNIVYFIEKLGFMPNCSSLLNRSQPPLFTKAVFEFYLHKNDKKVIEKYLPTILKEYDFWMTKRILPCGLNTYGEDSSEEELMENYTGLCDRVLEYRETREEQLDLAKDILAIAESGWDFNMRFATEKSKVDIRSFVQIDINCILYEVEMLISQMFSLMENKDGEEKFIALAQKRKNLMDEILYDKESGLYLDFNVSKGTFSPNVTLASFYPYVFGVSDDCDAAKKLLSRLEKPYGLSVGEFRGEDAVYFQWDYPAMWPSAVCLIYMGLKRMGLIEDAHRIANKYQSAVEKNYIKTGRIWEKYDATTGDIMVTAQEYGTPEMLGWTAATYRYFENDIKGY